MDEENKESEESEEQEDEEEEAKEEIVKPEIDIKNIEHQEAFSPGTGRKKTSHAWNKDKIQALIEQLKEDSEIGEVRPIELNWFWNNFRLSQSPIKYVGYYCRKLIQDIAESVGIKLEAHETGCKHFNTEVGKIEIRFTE